MEALQRVRPSWDYLICLHRAGWSGKEADVWFVDIGEPLPSVLMPLRAPDPDVVVHLQEALEQVYAEGRFAAAACSFALRELTGLDALPREKGLRA